MTKGQRTLWAPYICGTSWGSLPLAFGWYSGAEGVLWHIPFTSRVKWLNFGIVFRWLIWSAWPEVQLGVPFTNLISHYPRAVSSKTFPAVVTGSGRDMFTHGHAITWTHKNRFLLYVEGGCLTEHTVNTIFIFTLRLSDLNDLHSGSHFVLGGKGWKTSASVELILHAYMHVDLLLDTGWLRWVDKPFCKLYMYILIFSFWIWFGCHCVDKHDTCITESH